MHSVIRPLLFVSAAALLSAPSEAGLRCNLTSYGAQVYKAPQRCMHLDSLRGKTIRLPRNITRIGNGRWHNERRVEDGNLSICVDQGRNAEPTDFVFILDNSNSMDARWAWISTYNVQKMRPDGSRYSAPDTLFFIGSPTVATSGSITIPYAGTGTKTVPSLSSATKPEGIPAGDPFGIRALALQETIDTLVTKAPGSTAGYISFADRILTQVAPTVIGNPVLRAQVRLESGDGTIYSQPLALARQWLRNPAYRINRRQVVVMISDGEPEPGDPYQTIIAVSDSIPVYGISLGGSGQALERMAQATGATFGRIAGTDRGKLREMIKLIIADVVRTREPRAAELENLTIPGTLVRGDTARFWRENYTPGLIAWRVNFSNIVPLREGTNQIRLRTRIWDAKTATMIDSSATFTLDVSDPPILAPWPRDSFVGDRRFHPACHDSSNIQVEDRDHYIIDGISYDSTAATRVLYASVNTHSSLYDSSRIVIRSLRKGDRETYAYGIGVGWEGRVGFGGNTAMDFLAHGAPPYLEDGFIEAWNTPWRAGSDVSDSLVFRWQHPRDPRDTAVVKIPVQRMPAWRDRPATPAEGETSGGASSGGGLIPGRPWPVGTGIDRPQFNPPGRPFASGDTIRVTISLPSTRGAVVYYTLGLDGADAPMPVFGNSGVYVYQQRDTARGIPQDTIRVGRTTRIRAIAVRGGLRGEDASQTYTRQDTLRPPNVTKPSQTYIDSLADIRFDAPDPGALTFFTLDGREPDPDLVPPGTWPYDSVSRTFANIDKDRPFVIGRDSSFRSHYGYRWHSFGGKLPDTVTVKAISVLGSLRSRSVTVVYIRGRIGDLLMPTIDTLADTIRAPLPVHLRSNSTASIYYTIDGSDPDPAAACPTCATRAFFWNDGAFIQVDRPVLIKAVAVRGGDTSTVASFWMKTPLADVVATPAGRVFADSLDVALASATSGAEIWYTLDGSSPDSGAPDARLYRGPIRLSGSSSLRARAYKALYSPSTVRAEEYEALLPPIATPAGQGYYTSIQVALAARNTGASIWYTVDGSSPDSTNPRARPYTAGLAFTTTTTLKARAYKAGAASSAMTEVYTYRNAPLQGSYLRDTDGDGRADRVVATFQRRVSAGDLPDSFVVAWAGESRAATSWRTEDSTTYILDLATPFAFAATRGTGDAGSGTLEFVKRAGGSTYRETAVLRDSVDPVIAEAILRYADAGSSADTLRLVFSEPVAISGEAIALAGKPGAGRTRNAALSQTSYTLSVDGLVGTFLLGPSSAYLRGEFLRIWPRSTGSVRDARGNAAEDTAHWTSVIVGPRRASSAAVLDADGDGRADRFEVVFRTALSRSELADSMRVEWGGAWRTVTSWTTTDSATFVSLLAQPFERGVTQGRSSDGTGLLVLHKEVGGIAFSDSIRARDRVPAIILDAEYHYTGESLGFDTLRLRLSEPVRIAGDSVAWRDGPKAAGPRLLGQNRVRLSGDGRTLELFFDSSAVAPLPGDSAHLAASMRDSRDNAPISLAAWVPVRFGRRPPRYEAYLDRSLLTYTGWPIPEGERLVILVRAKGSSAWNNLDGNPSRHDTAHLIGPRLEVSGAVRGWVHLFDHLGVGVLSLRLDALAEALASERVGTNTRGQYEVWLAWNGRARNDRLAGSGVYIMRLVTMRPGDEIGADAMPLVDNRLFELGWRTKP